MNVTGSVPKKLTIEDMRKIPDQSCLSMTRDSFFEIYKDNGGYPNGMDIYGYYDGDYLMGLTTMEKMHDDTNCIDLIVVDEHYRRRGLATHMVKTACKKFDADYLSVKLTNTAARKVYEICEFTENITQRALKLVAPGKLIRVSANDFDIINVKSVDEIKIRVKSYKQLKAVYGEPELSDINHVYLYKGNIAYILTVSNNGEVRLSTYNFVIDARIRKMVLDRATAMGGKIVCDIWPDDEQLIKFAKSLGMQTRLKENVKVNAAPVMNVGVESIATEACNAGGHDEYMMESAEDEFYGLPDEKKYPMNDPKHVLLAIKFFNYVDEDKAELLASRINDRIKHYKIYNINVGEKNRFSKYYKPLEEHVMVDYAPVQPYMIANEATDPSVKLLDDGFAYSPIRFDRDLFEKYNGNDYYPMYIILMKNISPLGSIIRGYTGEAYSHSAISFDASMDDVYTFGNKVIKKKVGIQKSFGAAHESFRKNSFKFSYDPKTEYSLYVMFFRRDEIDRIKKKVDEIFLHHDEYKYNIEGLISFVFNKPKTDPHKLFCSQFVALIINSGREGILNKDPSLYSPVGLTEIRGITHIENGTLRTYDQYRVEKKTHATFDSLIENKCYEALEHANIMYNA